MTSIFGRKKNKSAARQFAIEFKKISTDQWRLTTPSFVRIWQTSNSLAHFIEQINKAAKQNHGTQCYEDKDSSLKSRISYLRNHRALPLREHKDENVLWDSQKSGKINWDELRDFCAETSDI